MPEPRASVGRRLAADIVVVLGVFLLAGAAAGALWPQLVDPVTVTRTDFGLVTDEVGLARRFDNEGWYAVLGGCGGLLLGVLLTAWRRTDEVVTVLVVVAGALLAAFVSARLGTWSGPDDPERVLADAASGTTAPAQVRLAAEAAYLVWPAAALVGAVVVLWASPRDDTGSSPRQSFRRR
jgi:hypothetical protein